MLESLGVQGVGESTTPTKDVLVEYDKALVQGINIALDVPYHYTLAEIDAMSTEELREVLDSRGRVSTNPHVPTLRKLVANSQKVPVVFNTPQAAWANSESMTGEEVDSQSQSTMPYYPIITITRMAPTLDPTRYSRPKRRKLGWSEDGNLVSQSNQPIPYNIPYQIDALALTMQDINAIQLALTRQWGQRNMVRAVIDHGPPWGSLPVFFKSDGIRDQSQNSGGPEKAEKLMWLIVTVTAEGWIPQEYAMERTVRKTQVVLVNNLVESRPETLAEFPVLTLVDTFEDLPIQSPSPSQ